MSKKMPLPTKQPISDIKIEKVGSVVTKWVPFICAGAAVGISILALRELKKIKKEMESLKNQKTVNTVTDPAISKKMEQLEEQLKMINQYLMNNNSKNPKIIKNAVKTEIPDTIKIINEQPEDNVEYEVVEVTDDEESDDEN
jgi:anion-transporting  ArsA/GET3 family ATPase